MGSDKAIAPCKDCVERESGCHGKCEKYAEYKKACAEKREKTKRDAFVDYAISRSKRKYGK